MPKLTLKNAGVDYAQKLKLAEESLRNARARMKAARTDAEMVKAMNDVSHWEGQVRKLSGFIAHNSTPYSNVKKGDRVSVKGAKKYDALSPDTVAGTVLFIHPDGKVAVQVGSGQMNVLPQDIVNAYSNGRMKAETYLNQKMAEAGVKVENASPGGKFTTIYEANGWQVSKFQGAFYVAKGDKSYEFMTLSDAKKAADTQNFSMAVR